MSYGIVSYFGVAAEDYHNVNDKKTGIETQRIPKIGEDSAIYAWRAAEGAIKRSGIDRKDIGKIIVASENHVMLVGATSIKVAEMLKLNNNIEALDTKNACASGVISLTDAYRMASHESLKGKYTLVIGVNCEAIKGKNVFFDKNSAGAAAFIIGEDPIAEIITNEITAYTSMQDDFFVTYEDPHNPVCDGRDSIHQYKKHVFESINNYLIKKYKEELDEHGIKSYEEAVEYIARNLVKNHEFIIHTPIPKIIEWITYKERDGFKNNPFKYLSKEQVERLFKHNSLSSKLANTFAANSLLNLVNFLDNAIVDETQEVSLERILNAFGSGANATTIGIKPTKKINDYDRTIKLKDMLVTNKDHELKKRQVKKRTKRRIKLKTSKPPLNQAPWEKATLIKFGRKNSLIRLNSGVEMTAKVVGCKNMEPGTLLEPTYKRIKLRDKSLEYHTIHKKAPQHASA